MNLFNKFEKFITENSLVKPRNSILLGVSGGPDSLTMLDLFYRLQEKMELGLAVFHLNHQLREEAEEEARFVADICDSYGIKVFIESCNVPELMRNEGLSPEEAARRARFRQLEKTMNTEDIDKAALAHNRDDNVETILLHLFRGTGLRGLTGIDPVSRHGKMVIIHPLLNIYRYEIEEYCRENNLNPRRDPTNEETIYVRNKLRHDIIPYIEENINPGFKNVLVNMADLLREEDNYLEEVAREKLRVMLLEEEKDRIILSLPRLQGIDRVVQRRIVRQALAAISGAPEDLYHNHFRAVEELIKKGDTGSQLDLPAEIKVKCLYDQFIIKRGSFSRKTYNYNIELDLPGRVELPGGFYMAAEIIKKTNNWKKEALKPEICLCDYGSIEEPLTVRTRRKGDKFCPLGMSGRKKIKDFFIDEKIPPVRREEIPLVVDKTGRIVWIAGLRMNDYCKVTGKTEKIVKIIFAEREGDLNEE